MNLFAMASTPRPVCVSRESNSSLKGLPYTDSPPVPVPVGSPPCSRWRMRLSRSTSAGRQIEITSTHKHVPATGLRVCGDTVHRQHVCPRMQPLLAATRIAGPPAPENAVVATSREDSARSERWQEHLDHEVLDAPVEHRARVVAAVGEDHEVLAGPRRDVAVHLQVEIAQVRVQPHVALLLGLPLHSDLHSRHFSRQLCIWALLRANLSCLLRNCTRCFLP